MAATPMTLLSHHRPTQVYLAYDERMLLHHAPSRRHNTTEDVNDPHFCHERPSRLLAVYEALVALEQRLVVGDNPAARRYIALDFAGASKETICRVHSTAHYDFLESTSHWSRRALRKLTAAADDLYYNRATFGAAVLAAGGCVAVAQAVTAPVSGSRRAMALVRPPSHHATRNAAMGFCYFNNIVIAARDALATGRAHRVFILDWDVHHGNGIQDLTYDDPDIFYLSIHRASGKRAWFYPGTGTYAETGAQGGVGTNLNIAFPFGGVGNTEYAAAFTELVLPVLEKFAPDLVLIACGADAAQGDLLGDFGLTPDMYFLMTKSVLETVGVDTPVVVVLEGGYNLPVLADCLQAVNLALLDEPFDKFVPTYQHFTEPLARSPSLTNLWTPEDKAHLAKRSIAKRALLSIRRAARALAFSQSRQGAYNCIQQPTGYVCVHDACQMTHVRRLRLLDFDRSQAWKKPRLIEVEHADDSAKDV